jgi:uncharacterized membrane protein YphA (DoxX/SURF4 family)
MSVAQSMEAAKTSALRAILNNRYLTLLFRIILAGIFLVSSYGKLVDIERYSVDAIYNFAILPMWLARPFGLVMPFIELLVGLGLLFGVLTRLSGLGAALMSLAFFIAKAVVLSQGRVIDCGCFGAIVETLASVTIYMDIPMLLMGLFVMFSTSRHWLAIGGVSPFSKWQKKLDRIW